MDKNFRNTQEDFRQSVPDFHAIFRFKLLLKTEFRYENSIFFPKTFMIARFHFSPLDAAWSFRREKSIFASNLNDQPDMSNRFKGATGQFRCINRTLLRMRVSISKFPIFKIFIFFSLRNQKRSSNLFLTFRYASFFLSNLLWLYSIQMSEYYISRRMTHTVSTSNQLLEQAILYLLIFYLKLFRCVSPNSNKCQKRKKSDSEVNHAAKKN